MSVKEVKIKKGKKKKYILLYLAIVGFVIYAVYALIGLNAELNSKKNELASYEKEISIVKIKNQELEDIYKATGSEYEQYIINKAREEFGYIKEGERVFEDVAG